MNIDPKRRFLKHLEKITDSTQKEEIGQVIETVKAAKTIKDIPRLRKLKGYKIHYRIRVGDYRIGLTIVGDLVTLEACMKRKDFYKYFP